MEAFKLWTSHSKHQGLVKLSTLPFGEYPVKQFYWVETPYGNKIKIDLGDRYVYLPPSISKNHTAETVASLNTISQIFVWEGYGEGQFQP